MSAVILVVEDDASIRRGLVDALRFAGYRPDEAGDGELGSRKAVQGSYDLVLLDVALPRRDGFAVLAEIRAARPTLPVIMLTARGDEGDRISGLQGGADDYVVKPFAIKELIARIAAVLRRSAERPSDVAEIRFAGGTIDLQRMQISFQGGGTAILAEREAELLRYLCANANRVISRDELLARVWRIDGKGSSTRSIDMQVARLREKLRDDADDPKIVLTVRGKGYRFVVSGSGAP
jgi:DNA-binding response OmpR family regulator